MNDPTTCQSSSGPVQDEASARWVNGLTGQPPARDQCIARLHTLLVKIARTEAARRSGLNGVAGQELDDIAQQAADDAVVSILRRIEEFRGDSKFTTWAYKFVVFELASKLSRHAWRWDSPRPEHESWAQLPARIGAGPEEMAQSADLVAAVRDAVEHELTAHQRRVFVAIVLDGIPLDVLVEELGSNRNAIYKTLFDARRKLHSCLVTRGYIASTMEREA